ncbi:MAG: DUF5752 family protein [Candidatus Woesearchaeota archaeon]
MGETFVLSNSKKGKPKVSFKAKSLKLTAKSKSSDKSKSKKGYRLDSSLKNSEIMKLAGRLNPKALKLLDFRGGTKDNRLGHKFHQKVKDEHKFYVSDGTELCSLHELVMAMRNMKDETFTYHVNESKNDFANWINHCLGEKELADELLKYNTKTSNELLILRHIASELKK